MTQSIEQFVQALPKAELHLHLEGAVAAPTVIDLAKKHGIPLPEFHDVSDLFNFPDLATFLKVYDLVCRAIRDTSDFQRITYEALAVCARDGARYVEFFFSPNAHLAYGVAYATMLDGIVRGMHDAERDLKLKSRLIPAHNRELGLDRGMAFLDMVLADRRDEVIGIGLDYGERHHPPAPYKPMYDRARAAGLRVTAHAGEDGPADNVRHSLKVLHCERIDHGYHVIDDPGLMAEACASGICFTCCPTTTLNTTVWRDLASPDHAIRRMVEGGLTVMLNTDDPGLFRTTLNQEYTLVMSHMDFSRETMRELTLNGLKGSWLDETTKRDWTKQWRGEIDALIAGGG